MIFADKCPNITSTTALKHSSEWWPIIMYGSQLENVSNGGNICTFTHKYAGECIIFHIEDLEYSNDPEIFSITKCRTDGNVNLRMAVLV